MKTRCCVALSVGSLLLSTCPAALSHTGEPQTKPKATKSASKPTAKTAAPTKAAPKAPAKPTPTPTTVAPTKATALPPRAAAVPTKTPDPLPPPTRPRFEPGAPAAESATYTGLIIDCTGLGLNATPSPKLMSEDDTEVYGTISVTEEYLFETGIVSYPKSMELAVAHARIGRRPLIVKALRVDVGTRCNPVVSLEDAKRIRKANDDDHFLERCAVVFVLTER